MFAALPTTRNRWTNSIQLTAASEEHDGAKQAAQHYEYAPLYMQKLQPDGTAGVDGKWLGAPVWPGSFKIIAAKQPFNGTGLALKFNDMRDW